jgi:acyl-CoA thioesterase-1
MNEKIFPVTRRALLGLVPLLGFALPARAEPNDGPVVVLGDSITKGVRPGVGPEETFGALLAAALRRRGKELPVRNLGIGGERTDQVLLRLDREALALRPRLVTVMYGTNDSYVDRGAQRSRISLEQYRENLTHIVTRLRTGRSRVLLMTPPRWAADAAPNGLGENPNPRLEPYVEACREVARQERVPLVDHFAGWTHAEGRGVNLRDWTTDGCHPNPRGHQDLAERLVPEVVAMLDPPPGPARG